jgi:hypothetical protein
MSQEDTLRLAAEIVDKFSGPLRDMTKSVHQFDDLLKGHQTRSTIASKEQQKLQRELNEQFKNTGRMVIGTINPAFAAMGLSVGAVAASTGLLIGQLRAAGDGFLKVQGAMRRTGMSNDGLEVWVRTLGKLGIDADEARGQLSSLGDVAARLHRNFSPQIQALESQFTNLSGLITNMSKASGAEASEMFWKYYLSHPAPPDQQRKLLAAVGLSPEIANATSDQIKEMIAKAQASVAAHPPIALETMNKIHEAFEEFDDMVKGLNLDLMNAFGGSGANAVKGFGEILHNEAEDIKYIITKAMEFNGWLDKIGGHGDIIGKIVTDMLHGGPYIPGVGGGDGGSGSGGRGRSPVWRAPSRNGYHPSSYMDGGSSGAEDLLSRGVKSGMLAAFREWFASTQSERGGGGGGGFTNASFSPSGGAMDDTPIGKAVRAARDATSGKPRLGGVDSNDGETSGTTGGGINRDKWLGQLEANPRLKEELFRRSLGENSNPMANQAVMEEAANRADIRGNKGFADHSNLSYFQGYHRGSISAKTRAMLDSNFDKVFRQGSDVAGGAIDNSSQWLSAKHERNGRFRTVVNYGGDRITGHRGVESFEVPGWGESGTGERARWPAYRAAQLKEAGERNLLANANKAGVGGVQKVEGDASVRVAFENMPAGAKAYMQHGGMFKTGTVDWGHAMPASDPGGR